MPKHADAVAECVLKAFEALPTKAKPRRYPNGSREWVPLSGVVVSNDNGHDREYHCVSLGTGMRCLPTAKLPFANGRCLHDWHAEIVAIRAFNHFILRQCLHLAQYPEERCSIVQRAAGFTRDFGRRPFSIRNDIRLHMYCSEAPCGDASMELIMAAQEDATPWEVSAATADDMDNLSGRGHFSMLGRVRRKPARADAPITLSKSCSDKLAMKQCTSMLSSLSSLFVNVQGAYLTDLILPVSRHSKVATQRAFSSEGRMAPFRQDGNDLKQWSDGYKFSPFTVEETTLEFPFRRNEAGETKATPSNIAAVWSILLQEVIIGGTIQGYKQFAQKGASAISRAKVWELSRTLAECLDNHQLTSVLSHAEYSDIKSCDMLKSRRTVKEDVRRVALRPWQRNSGDDSFSLDS